MKERFIESANGQYIRDLIAEKSYRLTVENVFIVLNRVDKWDNRAFDLIEKELAEQEDENVKKVLKKILYSLTKNEQYKVNL